MDIKCTQMTAEDIDEVLEFWKTIEGIGLDNDTDSRENLEKFLKRNPNLSFITRSGAIIVGAVLCGHDGRRGYLHHLAVAEDCRKQGIGSYLVEMCLSGLQSEGILKCNIFVFDKNVLGQHFWSNVGWKKRKDLLIMQKFTSD